MSLPQHNKTGCTCVENNTFIQNGGKILSRDKYHNYNISHVTNTENIVKLAQMIHGYIISALKKDNFQTNVNFDNKALQNTHASF